MSRLQLLMGSERTSRPEHADSGACCTRSNRGGRKMRFPMTTISLLALASGVFLTVEIPTVLIETLIKYWDDVLQLLRY